MSTRLLVAEEFRGMRLEHFLARQFPTMSRHDLRQAIASGLARVNQTGRRKGYRLQAGETVEVQFRMQPHPAFIPEPISIQVIFEDDHLLVLNKPGGMLTHPSKTELSGTLMNGLCHHLREQAEHLRPGLVHRLDRGTSGLMVVAKTEQAHRVLSKHFRKRLVVKKYIALAYGIVGWDAAEVSRPIGWVDDSYPHWQVTMDGREAVTQFQVINRYSNISVIEVVPMTGRTHQIRIHLAAIGHPIVGDTLYGGSGLSAACRPDSVSTPGPQRHFLHASGIEFKHPRTGKILAFSIGLPDDMAEFVKDLASDP